MISNTAPRIAIPRRTSAAVLAAGILGAASCGGGLDPEDVVGINGSYEAATFIVEEGGIQTYNLDVDGGLFEIELFTSQGRTSGRLVAPGLGPGGTELDVDLAGTWRFDQEDVVVRFDFFEDVFLEDLSFLASRRQLAADETLDGVRYLIVLQQISG